MMRPFFYERIFPQIRENITKYKEMANTGKSVEWKWDLNFVDEFNVRRLIDLPSVKRVHSEIVQEKPCTNLNLAIVFHTGLLYLNVRQFIPADIIPKEWYTHEFCVPYSTVERYINFSMIINVYPQHCALSFAQIIKHCERILNHLKIDTELVGKLKSPFKACVQNEDLSIIPVEVQNISATETQFATDSECSYEENDWHFSDDVDKTAGWWWWNSKVCWVFVWNG